MKKYFGKKKDPIIRIEKKLIKEKILDNLSINKVHEEIKYELNQAVKFAKSSPHPKILNMKKYVYA